MNTNKAQDVKNRENEQSIMDNLNADIEKTAQEQLMKTNNKNENDIDSFSLDGDCNLENEIKHLKKKNCSFFDKDKMRKSLNDCTKKIEKTCHSSAEKFNEKLYQKPLKSALIIGALGIVVGAIMGSGKKRNNGADRRLDVVDRRKNFSDRRQ